MHKLVILVENEADKDVFDAGWPEFLQVSEKMPGLIREVSCHVDRHLTGRIAFSFIHELIFDSLPALNQAMRSPEGQAAGGVLQKITGGKMTLLLSDHKEDAMEHILQYKNEVE